MFKSFLEQRLNLILMHLEEYKKSLRPFLQEAASVKNESITIEGRLLDLHRAVRFL